MQFKAPSDFLALGGEMGALIRARDWSRSPIGPIASWPRSLKGYVAMMLQMPTPTIIFWGDRQTQIYNTGYSKIMGPRHPEHMGSPYEECWPDTYPIIFPWMERVLRDGEVIEVEREHLVLTRHGFEEEAYFTFSFVPLLDDEGAVGGFIQPVHEVTQAVIAERRLVTLRALASGESREGDVVSAIAEALQGNLKDVPFALLYLAREEGPLDLVGGVGLTASLAADAPVHGVAREVLARGEARTLDDVRGALGAVHEGVWKSETRAAVALPLRVGHEAPIGVIVLGVSPRLRFDDWYRAFFESVAHDAAATIAVERERREHEATVRRMIALLDHQPELAWTAGAEGKADFFNQRWADYSGVATAGLQGDAWQALVEPGERDAVVEAWAQSRATGAPFEREFPIRGRDGSYRWHLTRIVPLRRGDGAIDRWFATSSDVQELRETRASTEALLAQVRSQSAEMEEALLALRAEKERLEAEHGAQ